MNKIISTALLLFLLISCVGCGGDDREKADMNKKELIVYYPNWKYGNKNGNVEDIPWEQVTMINHAFWEIVVLGDEKESSFERRDAGKPAREEFSIVSTDPETDREIFKKYREYHDKYPDVKIMISIGGSTRCGFFSEMAYTEAGRKSFVSACVELIKENEWIAGIDIDWEYPAGSVEGERMPAGSFDQGCPIFGTSKEDNENFTKLLKDLKEGLDEEFGTGKKLLTACASCSTGWLLPTEDWLPASKYLDHINIMTYDMAGDWDNKTGHASSLMGTETALKFFKNKGIDLKKVNIGVPYYGTGFKLASGTKEPLTSKIVVPNDINTDYLTMEEVARFEESAVPIEEKGWHKGYDEREGGAYLWCDDEESEFYCWYISYDDIRVLEGKLTLVDEYSLSGILVWEITEDTYGHDYTVKLSTGLNQ